MSESGPEYDLGRELRPLTRRQEALLRFIIRYKGESGGDSPTVREMMRGVGITSASVVNYNVGVLEKHGLVSRPFRSARCIAVTGGRWVYERPA